MKKKEGEKTGSGGARASIVSHQAAPAGGGASTLKTKLQETVGMKARTEQLQLKAKENAIRELQVKMNLPECLSKCSLMIVEYERKLEFLESTLSSGVQLQLNEVARAGVF
jgi:hypothetical protein